MDTLDVRGLPGEKVDYLKLLIDRWRQEAAKIESDGTTETDEIVFTTQKSRVIGSLTRQDIYEYL